MEFTLELEEKLLSLQTLSGLDLGYAIMMVFQITMRSQSENDDVLVVLLQRSTLIFVMALNIWQFSVYLLHVLKESACDRLNCFLPLLHISTVISFLLHSLCSGGKGG